MKKLLVVLLVLVFAAPAMAAEWNMYGSARLEFFYDTVDEDASDVGDLGQDADGNALGDPESDTDLSQDLQGNARIGANVKATDMVSGRFEYGHGPNPSLRLLYGTVKFGAASLVVGQAYTPIDTLYSGQVIDDDIGLLKEGCVYEGRIPQLKLQIGGFQAALLKNSAGDTRGASNDVLLPKIELAYDMKMTAFSIGGFLGFQTYDDFVDGTDESEAVSSFVLGVRSKIKAGPAYINVVLSFAQNAGNYGVLLRNGFAGSQNATGTDREDSTTIAAALIVGAKLGSSLKIEGGVGYLQNSVTDGATDADLEGNAMTYYINLPITLAKGVFIVPEISIFDLGENDTDGTAVENGQRTVFGAKFQVNF